MSKSTDVTADDRPQTFPYYKIQVWNDDRAAWTDVEETFETLDDLACYAIMELDWDTTTRMVTVKAEGKEWIDPDFDAFGEPR